MDKRKDGWFKMKKILLLVPVVAMLAACGTTDVYQKRAENERKYEESAKDKMIDAMPDWYTNVPVSSSAIYSAGMGQADTPEMAITAAQTAAKAKICYSADGEVTSQTKDFATGSSKTSRIERVTRTNCNNVSIAGIEYAGDKVGKNPKIIRTGNTFTAYVLMALPTGDANVQRKYLDTRKREALEAKRADEAFKELPKAN